MKIIIFSFSVEKNTGGMEWTGETEVLGEKPVPEPLFPPQKSHMN
jgi:hypothetical protein